MSLADTQQYKELQELEELIRLREEERSKSKQNLAEFNKFNPETTISASNQPRAVQLIDMIGKSLPKIGGGLFTSFF